MEDYSLGQSLIVHPDTPFAVIASKIQQLGWSPAARDEAPTSVRQEPDFASWTWHGQKPVLIYSFNPIPRLRVLDVATLPPALRGQLAQALPMLALNDVNDLLFHREPRQRLLGLWAAQETERVDLRLQAHRLTHDPDHQVAAVARQVEARLQTMQESREALAISLVQLADVARPVIKQLNNPAATAHLKPTRDEVSRLFDPGLTDALTREIDQLYFESPIANPGDDYPELSVTAVNAGLLRWSNEFSDKFPQGYRNVAGWMQPQWTWLSWRWSNASKDSVQYDGLVWAGTRWVWIPKAFRLISKALQQARSATLQ